MPFKMVILLKVVTKHLSGVNQLHYWTMALCNNDKRDNGAERVNLSNFRSTKATPGVVYFFLNFISNGSLKYIQKL